MAAGTPDEKFLKLREENEKRRKKKEEEEKRRKQDDEQKAKEALERRRQERLEQDERMRKPWQQPPAPKKPILRKGAKQKPVQPVSPGADPVRQSQTEEKRREMRQGLQDFIRQQRQVAAGAKTPTGGAAGPAGRQQQQGGGAGADGGPVVPLTWEELRMAAEAGFDELLRQQELQAAEEPQNRAARHRSPYKSPFKGAPAPPLETVQVALVPTHNYNSITATASAAGVASTSAAAVPSPGRGPGAHAHPSASQFHASGAAGPDPAAAAAALRNSYKFSDAPGWVGRGPAGAEPAGSRADPAVGASAGGAPSVVLYPPAHGSGADAQGRGSWADGFQGRAGDGHAGTSAGPGGVGTGSSMGTGGDSVASSGGLRRGVTTTTRYRAAPLDPSALDLASADPCVGPGGHGGPPEPTGTAPAAVRSPRGSVGSQRAPLPGPYDSPSQQQWPAAGGAASTAPDVTGGSSAGGAGVAGGAARHLALPADPLEASLLADGTMAALQQSDGFRLSSPRPGGSWQQPMPQPSAAVPQLQASQVQSQEYAAPPLAQAAQVSEPQRPVPALPPQAGKADQRHARRGWGVPAPPPAATEPNDPYNHGPAYPTEPPAPPWALSSPTGAAAGSDLATAGISMVGSMGGVGAAPVPAASMLPPAYAAAPAAAGIEAYGIQARSPAAVRHSVAVGDSGGLDMWSRESVPLLQVPPAGSEWVNPADLHHSLAREASPPPLPPPAAPLSSSPPHPPGLGDDGSSVLRHLMPPGPRVDMSADLVRFSSPPGPGHVSSSVTACESPLEQPASELEQQPQVQARHRLSGVSYNGVPLHDGSEAAAGAAEPQAGAATNLPAAQPMASETAVAAGAPRTSVESRAALSVDGSEASGFHAPQQADVSRPPSAAAQHSPQGPLLPPIPPAARSSSVSAKALLPAGVVVPLPQVQLHGAPEAGVPANGPAPPSQPPIRAPSPPASPPRRSPSQRFQRGAPQSFSGAAPIAGGHRPLSADSFSSSGVAAVAEPSPPVAPPPAFARPVQADPQQQPQQPLLVGPGSMEGSPQEWTAMPPSPRTPGIVAATLASPSRLAGPAAPVQSVSQQWQAAQPSPQQRLQHSQHQPLQQQQPSPSQSAQWQGPQHQPPPAAPVGRASAQFGAQPGLQHNHQEGLMQQGPELPVAVVALRASGHDPEPPSGRGLRGSGAAVTDVPVVAEEPSGGDVTFGGAQAEVGDVEVERTADDDADIEVEDGGDGSLAAGEAGVYDADGGDDDMIDYAADGAAGASESGGMILTRGSASRGFDSSLGRPPGTAEGSILTGSHISARPWSGPSTIGPGSERPGSAYQTSSLLDDSVSSFNFRMRSETTSRPASASASCSPAAPPASSLIYATQTQPQHPAMVQQSAQKGAQAGAGPIAGAGPGALRASGGRVPAAWSPAASGDSGSLRLSDAAAQSQHALNTRGGVAVVPNARGQGLTQVTASRPGPVPTGASAAAMAAAGGGHRVTGRGGSTGGSGGGHGTAEAVAAPNAFQVLNRPAGSGLYGSRPSNDGDGGDGQPFMDEPLDDPEDGAPAGRLDIAAFAAAPLAQAPAVPAVAPPAVAVAPGAAPAAAAQEPDLDALMREIQELSALRKALKAEFEYMGHGDAVMGLGTLSANFTPLPAVPPVSGAESTGTPVAAQVPVAPQPPAPMPPPPQQQQQPQVPLQPPSQLQQQQQQILPQQQPTLPPQQAMPAPPPPQQQQQAAPLLHWGVPGVRGIAAPQAAVAQPTPTPQPPPQLPPQHQLHQLAAPPQHQPPAAQQAYQLDQYPAAPVYPSLAAAELTAAGLPYDVSAPPATVTLGPNAALPFTALPPGQHPAVGPWNTDAANGAGGAAPAGYIFPEAEDPNGRSFAFMPMTAAAAGPGGAQSAAELVQTHPYVMEPVPQQPLAAAPPAPPSAAAPLQWTIPVSAPPGGVPATGAAAAPSYASPSRAARPSGPAGGPAAGAAGGGEAALSPGQPQSVGAMPRKTFQTPKRTGAGGSYAQATVDSPGADHPPGGLRSANSLTAASPTAAGGRGGAAGPAAPPERPLINEGSYAVAAVQARDRAEKERAAREALQAEAAAAKAAAVQRSKSERTAGMGLTAAGAAGAAGAGAGRGPSGSAAGRQSAPLKAPSSIGSYVRQPSPVRPQARTTAAARGRSQEDDLYDELFTPDSAMTAASGKHAWDTPTAAPARPSRIPTPPRIPSTTTTKPSAPAASTPPPPPPPPPAREDSLDSDFDFLERASDISDSETDSPEAYGVTSSKTSTSSPPPPPPRREAFASPSSATTAAAATAAFRERLAEARPQPLRIPTSGAATPMGGASTASTVASRAVPTGGRGQGMGAAAYGRNGGPPGGKPATPFTAAIRELMGLPGSAPLEQSRAAAGHHHHLDARGPWPGRLTEEEDKLLASLKRLDSDILKRGLTAAGLINEPQSAANGHTPTPATGKVAGAGKVGGKGRAGAAAARGAAANGAGGRNPALTNSVQQDQLRESLERLDLRLGQLRRKMEDRACTLGMPSASGAPTPSGVAPNGAAATPNGARRDPTPPRDDRRGPPATLAKSRTPTPNKAKAIRDQRQQQLSAVAGPTPPPARPPGGPTSAPPKPASAPVMATATFGAGGPAAAAAAPDAHGSAMPLHLAAGGAAAGVGPSAAGQPYGMPPRAPASKAPASAPSGPAAVNAALQQQQQQQQQLQMQQQQQQQQQMQAMAQQQMYGGMQMPYGANGNNSQQQPQQQQVAYVPAMLPNGQMAYVPQFVSGGANPGFPGFFAGAVPGQGQPQPQPPLIMMQPGGAPGMFPGGMMPVQQQQQPTPMVAWGAAQQQQPPSPYGNAAGGGGGSPSLYSFDTRSAGSNGANQGSNGYGVPPQQQQQQLQHPNALPYQAPPSALPYASGPPPNGPLPHYHSTVMRSRSVGSRDGEAVAAAAVAAGLAPGYGHAASSPHSQQQLQHPQGPGYGQNSVPQSPPQQSSYDAVPYGGSPPGRELSQGGSQPHAVQFQSFGPGGGHGSSRGLGLGGTGGGWGMGGGVAGGVNGGSGGESGVIKAVNLGLLMS